MANKSPAPITRLIRALLLMKSRPLTYESMKIPRRLTMLKASLCLLTAGTLHGLSVEAVPRRIILLRHAEKANSHALCKTGLRRSIALRHHYLGRNALNPSLLEGQVPGGIVAITLHTIETAGQTAFSWGLPINTYAAMPGENGMIKPSVANSATQEAASDVLGNSRWHDRIVLMFWEHHHIASPHLERQYAGEKVTLRQLLNIEHLENVPQAWEHNYDYFWVIDYDPDQSKIPIRFQMVKQTYPSPFDNLPHNGWGEDLPKDYPSSCLR